jgi:hypothetical protein
MPAAAETEAALAVAPRAPLSRDGVIGGSSSMLEMAGMAAVSGGASGRMAMVSKADRVAAVVGVVMLGTAALGMCPAYMPFKISTCKVSPR